jgi:hypothetical protein
MSGYEPGGNEPADDEATGHEPAGHQPAGHEPYAHEPYGLGTPEPEPAPASADLGGREQPLLEVRGLSVSYRTRGGAVRPCAAWTSTYGRAK